MRRGRQQVNAQPVDINGQVTQGLHGVNVKIHARFTGYFAYLFDGLDGAHLVIGMHHGYQQGLITNSPLYIAGVNQTIFIHRYNGYIKIQFFHKIAGI